MTDRERWARLESLYHDAAGLPAEARAAFLDRECGEDPDLRAEVEALLAQGSGVDVMSAIQMIAVRIATQGHRQPGDQIGPYRITALLGVGGMGEVYSARDTKLGRDVAIKVLPRHLAHDSDRIARFFREARLLAALNHPNIAQIHGIEHSHGIHALVMELIEGETLADRIARGPMSLNQALAIAEQIAKALAAAHERGILHRDLKPANVKLRPDGSVKVLDFGLAKWTETDAPTHVMNSPMSPRSTQLGLILGTAAYMSPEQAAGQPVDRRTDLWSFGAVLFEMLSGRRPFDGETLSHVLAAVLKSEPDWSLVPSPTPAAIQLLLQRCLQKDRVRRMDSAAVAALDIEDALRDAATNSPLVAHVPRRVAAVSLSLILTGLVTASAFWSLTPAKDQPGVRRLTVSIPEDQAFVDSAGTGVSIARDGTAIVYSGRGPRGFRLYYRPLDRLEGTALPGTDNACCPGISPSGKWVAFSVNDTLYKVSVRGGLPIPLTAVSYQCGATWGSDDVIYYAQSNNGPLLSVPANGGTPQAVARPEAGGSFCMPVAMPDVQRVLVWDAIRNHLNVINPTDRSVRALTGAAINPIGASGGFLAFGRPDATLAVSPFDPERTASIDRVIPIEDHPHIRNSGMQAALSRTGDLAYVAATNRTRVAVLDAKGRVIARSSDDHNLIHPRVSPDGRRVVVADVSDDSRTSDLWVFDIQSNVLQRLTTDGRSFAPEWMPDGQGIVYCHSRHGGAEAYVLPSNGVARPLLSTPDLNVLRIVIAPDSQRALIVAREQPAGLSLHSVALNGDPRPTSIRTASGRFLFANAPAISPDGRLLAYESNESGVRQVYLRTFPDIGPPVQITLEGGYDPRWRPDSRTLVYRSGEEFFEAHVSIEGGVRVTRRMALYSFSTGESHMWHDLQSHFDVAPDGRLVALQPATGQPQIVLVTNWLEEVKKRAGK